LFDVHNVKGLKVDFRHHLFQDDSGMFQKLDYSRVIKNIKQLIEQSSFLEQFRKKLEPDFAESSL